MAINAEQSISNQLGVNDKELDNIANAIANKGYMAPGSSNHLVGVIDANDGLDTGELFGVTRATQKIENEAQLLPVPKNKQNEIVKGAIEQMKRA